MTMHGDYQSRTKASSPVPQLSDFVNLGEVLVTYSDDGPDRYGRRTFFAYWVADNVGYHLNEHGVRAQVFHTNPAGFVARQEHHGHTVREFTP